MSFLLRDVETGDLGVFFEHQRDPESNRMAGVPAREREAFTAHWEKNRADPTVVLMTIVSDGEVAGNLVSWDDSGRRLVGYWIGREHWGRGLASAGLAAFLEHVTERPLYAIVSETNGASRRVLEKAGFTVCGAEGDDAIVLELR
jgi:RimJ/RimL family protein N-acetyltransferase